MRKEAESAKQKAKSLTQANLVQLPRGWSPQTVSNVLILAGNGAVTG